jgi:hypothetical protein
MQATCGSEGVGGRRIKGLLDASRLLDTGANCVIGLVECNKSRTKRAC